MESLERRVDRDLHYTSVISLSNTDLNRIKSLLVETMENYNQTVAHSSEEECFCLTLDFFCVTEN